MLAKSGLATRREERVWDSTTEVRHSSSLEESGTLEVQPGDRMKVTQEIANVLAVDAFGRARWGSARTPGRCVVDSTLGEASLAQSQFL